MPTQLIPLHNIKVSGRFREDLGDIDSLANDIKEVGLIQPITVRPEGTGFKLLAGGRRFAAHEKLGLEKIECIIRKDKGIIDDLSIELIENISRKDMTWQERCRLEKEIYEQRRKAGNWNMRKQAQEFDQATMTTQRSIRMAEALDMMPDLGNYVSFDQAWKEYKKIEEDFVSEVLVQKTPSKIKEASQWAQDHYKVGDAFQGMSECRDELIHFAEIDPPYGVDLHARKDRNASRSSMIEYNEIDSDEYLSFYEKVAREVYRILRPDTFAIFWYGMSWHHEVQETLRRVGFKIPDIPAVWTKGSAGQTASPNTTLGSCYEPFFLARKGKPVLKKPGRGNVFDYKPVGSTKKIHPTERPLDLMEEILNTCLHPGSILMVPFLGSGVTLRAAYRTGHTGFGWDLSRKHKVKFLQRVAEDTNVSAPDEDETEETAE